MRKEVEMKDLRERERVSRLVGDLISRGVCSASRGQGRRERARMRSSVTKERRIGDLPNSYAMTINLQIRVKDSNMEEETLTRWDKKVKMAGLLREDSSRGNHEMIPCKTPHESNG